MHYKVRSYFDWTRLLDSMDEIAGGVDEDGDGIKETQVLSIKPYIWDDEPCRTLVKKFASSRIVKRIRELCSWV